MSHPPPGSNGEPFALLDVTTPFDPEPGMCRVPRGQCSPQDVTDGAKLCRSQMFSKDVLRIDAAAVAIQIEQALKSQVLTTLRRRGIVVGLSGGIDSSVVTSLAARAMGPNRVLVLLMPERDSASESAALGRLLAGQLGVPTELEELGAILDAAGCYARQDAAIRTIFPEYGEGYRCKITLPSILDDESAERVGADHSGAER